MLVSEFIVLLEVVMVRIVGGILAFLLVASAAGIVANHWLTDEQAVSAQRPMPMKKPKKVKWTGHWVKCEGVTPGVWQDEIHCAGSKRYDANRCKLVGGSLSGGARFTFYCW